MRGTDEFTADSLVYDNLNHLANLQGRVKGVLTPAQATGRSKR
jgi:lipopolysaccharide export system protein LptC